MSYQVLARKWRPKTFDQLVGQEHVVQALVNGLDQDRVHHAFLFTGTRGVGKTTLARIFAKCLNCEKGMSSKPCGECGSCVDIDEGRFVDMLEIDAASRTKVDDTRELLESVQYTPTRGRYKVYIIDEVHMLSNSSFNALLKTLEEPPPHVKFILATTDPERIPVTILSRCLQFNLRRMTPEQVLMNLQQIVESEGIEAEREALSRLARAADGSMRDGLSLLDQAIAYGAGKLSLEEVKQMLGLVDHAHIAAMITALANGDAAGLLDIVEELVARSRDLDAVLVSLAETLHRICLLQRVPDYNDEERGDWDAIRNISDQLSPADAQLFYQIAIKGREELGIAPDPRTGLEMTLLRMLTFRPAAAGNTSAGNSGKRTAQVKASSADSGYSASKDSQALDSDLSRSSKPKTVQKNSGSVSAKTETSGESRLLADTLPVPAAVTLEAETASNAPRAELTVGEDLFLNKQAGLAKVSMAELDTHARPDQPKEPDPGPSLTDAEFAVTAWLEMAEELDLKGPVRELARNLQLLSAKDGVWQFVISHSLNYLASKAYLERIRLAIEAEVGHPVQLVLSDSEDGVLHTAAALEQSRMHTKMTEAERSIEQDPTIVSLKKNLGAQVIEDSIQPVQ